MKKFATRAMTGLVAATCALGLTMTPASAAEQSEAQAKVSFASSQQGQALLISLEDGSTFEQTPGGDVRVLTKDHKLQETLPRHATDADGNRVGFYYRLAKDNQLEVYKTEGDGTVAYGWWSDWGKCAAGIGGGLITGAGTIGTAAAGVGVAGGPWGAAAGAIGGGIVGGVGGALTGAAAAC